ncbi:hypothetical protein [Phenylobacterium sp.]|uniref:hypothetical protein n=1 Tax=Phenylobacterium sp. TaxID=1871053 RepID=UPI0026172917|nr:hypothetical protein [Phenylobacterium sp.]
MRTALASLGLAATILGLPAPSGAQPAGRPPAYAAPPVIALEAERLREYAAPEARQGVAVDADHVYAVVNTTIAKYDKSSGQRLGVWSGPREGLIRHLNSCFAEAGKLWCANSNFPQTPMASSVEVFNTADMTHAASHSLGILDEGSLTFFERFGEGWIAGYAHYDDIGGLSYKDAVFAGIVFYDSAWRRTGGYALPQSVLERMAPHAASGGVLGPDGLLYLFGHDRPELYVVARPVMGPTLIHVATISVDAPGQAIAWDHSSDERILFTIHRPTGAIRSFRLPEVPLDHSPDARRFAPEGG